ncbi:MAG TPA: LacI family DNA-binding transcriptional regulator [Victivallales bacterium]|nr:LacI family DNA-binding transcriptional regulator [Victivallales bacterium]
MTKKTKIVYDKLREAIMNLPPNTRIPPIRDLMKKYRVSQSVIDSVLQSLRKEGLLISYVGDGTYTLSSDYNNSSKILTEQYKIAIVIPDYPSAYVAKYAKVLFDTTSINGMIPELIQMKSDSQLKNHISHGRYDAIIIFPRRFPIDLKELLYLKTLMVPVVVVESNLQSIGFDSVSIDDEMAGVIAASHLINLGHRKLAIFDPEPPTTIIELRKNGFFKHCSLNGIKNVSLFSAETKYGDDATLKAYTSFKRIISEGIDFTALFCLSEIPVAGILKAASESNLKIPQDLSIIAVGALSDSAYFSVALSLVWQDIEACAEAALKMILSRLEGDKSPTKWVSIMPELALRESTMPLKLSNRDDSLVTMGRES